MATKSEHARSVYAEIEKQLKSTKVEEVVWGIVEGASAVIDGVTRLPCAGPASKAAKMVYSRIMGSGADSLIDNPYFVGNGHGEDDPSIKTRRYLEHRLYKGLGGGAAGIAGGVGSFWTGVDISGIAMHGNASWTTGAHLKVLAQQAARSRKGGTVAQWLELVIKLKAIKMAARGTSLAGASIPIPAVGMGSGLLSAAAATGAKLTLTKACLATSLELHWRARQEQFFSDTVLRAGGGKVGPASRIVWELFTKRGITRILGKYDIAAFIEEPAGWHAIADKLLLI